MSQRLKQAEQELKESRAQAEALRQRGDADDVRKLRREFGHLQAMLAERDTEIAQLRLDSEHARERWTAEARTSLQKAEHDWKTEAQEAEWQKSPRLHHAAHRARRRAGRVALRRRGDGVSAFRPGVGRQSLAAARELVWMPRRPSAKASQPAQKAPVAAQPMATVLRAANVRSAPSKTAGIIATLARDADVPVLEHRGNWERVKITAAHRDQEGWSTRTYLKPKAVTASAPALQKHT